jgi:hypothetical protein
MQAVDEYLSRIDTMPEALKKLKVAPLAMLLPMSSLSMRPSHLPQRFPNHLTTGGVSSYM